MAGSGKAGASSPSPPPSPPSVAGAARGPQSGDVTSGGDGRCPHGGGVASGSGRHGSATVSGGSPRCDVGRPTDSDGRATRVGVSSQEGVELQSTPERDLELRGPLLWDERGAAAESRP
ncbi:hypothetical protein ACOMHN_057414 [Nucella lapillus]